MCPEKPWSLRPTDLLTLIAPFSLDGRAGTLRRRNVMEAVKLGDPKVEGIDSQYAGLVVVRAPLEPKPPRGWTDVFEDNPHFSGWPLSLHKPRVTGGSIEIHVPDEDVQKGLTALRKRIDWTNDKYEREVLPALEEKDRADADAKTAHEKRIEDAQRKLDELG
jgi:hypothetical protein